MFVLLLLAPMSFGSGGATRKWAVMICNPTSFQLTPPSLLPLQLVVSTSPSAMSSTALHADSVLAKSALNSSL
jgi:hypothetical protein